MELLQVLTFQNKRPGFWIAISHCLKLNTKFFISEPVWSSNSFFLHKSKLNFNIYTYLNCVFISHFFCINITKTRTKIYKYFENKKIHDRQQKFRKEKSPMFFHKALKWCPIKKETKNRVNKSLVSLPQKRLTFQISKSFVTLQRIKFHRN